MFVLGAIFIAPCLPTRSQKAPSGSAWIHEIKHDGYRLIARDGRHNLVGLPTVPRQHRHFPERCIWSPCYGTQCSPRSLFSYSPIQSF